MADHATSSHPAQQRILVRGVNWLGDAVMTTPALRRLREKFPAAHISLLTQEKLAGLWQAHPSIDAVICFSRSESVWQVAGRLRAGQFQLGIALPNSARSAIELWLARIPHRLGYGGGARNLLLTQVARRQTGALHMRKRSDTEIRRLIQAGDAAKPKQAQATDHHIHHYLHLLAALGCAPEPVAPELVVLDAEVRAVREKFGLVADDRPWFGLNTGAEYGPAKRWPRERFVAAAVQLQQRTRCRWLILGGSGDVDLAGGVAEQILAAAKRTEPAVEPDSVVNLAGKTSLRELCAALKVCRVLLTNDTGPMHVAAALGTPVVVPFGSTSPELTGPGLPSDPRHRLLQAGVPCAPCFRRVCPIDFRCMSSISVEQVEAAVLEVAGL